MFDLKNDAVKLLLVGLAAVAFVYLLNPRESMKDVTVPEEVIEEPVKAEDVAPKANDTDPVNNLGATGFDGLDENQMRQACFPTDRELNADDLLPPNEFQAWSEVHPQGQGALEQKNFLHAGHHIGINTVGQSLRNASHDIRSSVPNVQIAVSPWNQTTIGSELTRRPLEIS